MDQFVLFGPTWPLPCLLAPITITVPDRHRAELYRSALENAARQLHEYVRRHPGITCFADSIALAPLLQNLAHALDVQVIGQTVRDVNAFKANAFPAGNLTQATWLAYVATCLQHGAPPAREGVDVLQAPDPDVVWQGISAFYERDPLALQMVTRITNNFIANLLLCCDRIREDWLDLQALFCAPGTALQELSHLQASGSDSHKGGAQVLILTFTTTPPGAAAQLKMVYKPADVERDFRLVGDSAALAAVINTFVSVNRKGTTAALLLNAPQGSLAETFSARAPATPPYQPSQQGVATPVPRAPVYRILPVHPGSSLQADALGRLPIRQSYGYIEYLTTTPGDRAMSSEPNDPQRAGFMTSFGAQLALCWLFQVTDLHQENLLVHAQLPYLIDLESAPRGILALAGQTGLKAALKDACSVSRDVFISGWGGNDVYAMLSQHDVATANTPLGANDQPIVISAQDTTNISTAFAAAASSVVGDMDAYLQWLSAGSRVVTRVLPFSTMELSNKQVEYFVEHMHGVEHSPGQVVLASLEEGELSARNWTIDAAANSAYALFMAPGAWRPNYALLLHRQTAVDFCEGDIPTFYQSLATADVLDSTGARIPVPFDAGIAANPPDSRAALTARLNAIWMPSQANMIDSYFPDAVLTVLTMYLGNMRPAAGPFGAQRISTCADDITTWYQ